jgi:flagellar assembly factor FliW
MKFTTERFGTIEINPVEIFDFPLGIIGFPEYRRYGVHRDEKLAPFIWLQSLEEPRLCFFVVEPFLLFPDYQIEVRIEGILERDLTDKDDLLVLAICTIAAEFRDSTANLLAPLIVNRTKRIGYQIVLEDSEYITKHRLFPGVETECENENTQPEHEGDDFIKAASM